MKKEFSHEVVSITEESAEIIVRSYRQLEEVYSDLYKEYWNIKELDKLGSLGDRIKLFGALEKALTSFVKNVPEAVGEYLEYRNENKLRVAIEDVMMRIQRIKQEDKKKIRKM